MRKAPCINADQSQMQEAPANQPERACTHSIAGPPGNIKKGVYNMNPFVSVIDTEKVPTPDELYKVAVFIENAAAVTNVLVGVSMSESDKDSVMEFLSASLSVAAEVLTMGLDTVSGTFSNPAKIKKVS